MARGGVVRMGFEKLCFGNLYFKFTMTTVINVLGEDLMAYFELVLILILLDHPSRLSPSSNELLSMRHDYLIKKVFLFPGHKSMFLSFCCLFSPIRLSLFLIIVCLLIERNKSL